MRLHIIVYTATLFIACMVCHGELYRLKPPPKYLTGYFLYISAGGALGGFFVAILAPAIFQDYRELQLGLWVLSYGLGVLCFRHRGRARSPWRPASARCSPRSPFPRSARSSTTARG